MSTRSLIAMRELPKTKTGRGNSNLRVIYCHWDGYPSHNGRILLENYTTPEKVRALLNLGDLSVLAPNLGHKHDFNEASELHEGQCTSYRRDRGEGLSTDAENYTCSKKDGVLPTKFLRRVENSWCEYLYVFDESTKTWSFSNIVGNIHLKELTAADCHQ